MEKEEAKTARERKAEERQRKLQLGLVRVDVWVHGSRKGELKKLWFFLIHKKTLSKQSFIFYFLKRQLITPTKKV